MRYDVIIIGTGAGGGTIARALAPTGKRILILERGGFLPRERENWDPRAVFEEKRYLAKETWYDRDDQPFQPYTHYWVGGNTKVYGAALLRLREHDFGEISHYGGLSPAWPVSYDEFEPYYAKAEAMYHAHGERGSDPCEPRASGPFPYPALAAEPAIAEFERGLRSVGCRPFPAPLGVRIDQHDHSRAPYRFSSFDGYPDLTEVKADAQVVGVSPALRHPNVTLITDAFVERLETEAQGYEVRKVVARVGGELVSFSGDIVVLAAGAINSAAILLRSASDKHPDGLANGSGQVGRNYMTHQNGCFLMVREDENPSPFQKHFAMTEFYSGADDSAYPLGTIQLMGKPDRGTVEWLRGGELPGVPIEDIMRRTIDFFLTAEDLPDPNNRITLRPDGSIRVSYRVNNAEAYDRLDAKLRAILTRLETSRSKRRPAFFASRLGVSGVSHQNGTLRFGRHPSTSVLDPDCKAHELDNLYVADASFFPSSGAVNPSLTVMANALRVADRIMERLGVASHQLEGSMR